jgi:hypothetical protein
MKKLFLRLKAETPLFFKRMQWFGASLVGIEITINSYTLTLGELPEFITNIGTYAATIGVTIIIISQFAVKNIDLLSGKDDDKEFEQKTT